MSTSSAMNKNISLGHLVRKSVSRLILCAQQTFHLPLPLVRQEVLVKVWSLEMQVLISTCVSALRTFAFLLCCVTVHDAGILPCTTGQHDEPSSTSSFPARAACSHGGLFHGAPDILWRFMSNVCRETVRLAQCTPGAGGKKFEQSE